MTPTCNLERKQDYPKSRQRKNSITEEMRKEYLVLFVALLLSLCGNETSAQKKNPFLSSSEYFTWDESDTLSLKQAVTQTIKEVESLVKSVVSVPKEKRNDENTVKKLDLIWFKIMNLNSKIQLITAVSKEEETKRIAYREGERLGALGNELTYNKQIYLRLKDISLSPAMNTMAENRKKKIRDELTGFEARGIQLSEEDRKELKSMQNQISKLGTEFEDNIWEDADTLLFTDEELAGIPMATKSTWKKSDNTYHIAVNRQNNKAISTYAQHPATRRKMYIQHLSKAYPENKSILDSLIKMRYSLARKLGYKSYAELALKGSMAKEPHQVWSFQNDLEKKLNPMVERNIQQLRLLKASENRPGDTLFLWDIDYYKRKMQSLKYEYDADELKKYFEINHTVNGMLHLFEELFSLHIKEVTSAPVWNSKVRCFELWIDGRKAGIFYLDLLSRKNKADGFFCNPVSIYYKNDQSEFLPASALVGNFAESDESNPILLDHDDVVLLFHEFGHILHSLIGRTELASQWSLGVKDDFTEAPSQFLENWCWEYQAVSRFARHYVSGEKLPLSLFEKRTASYSNDLGIDYMSDLYYGLLDLTLYDNEKEFTTLGAETIAKKLYALNHVPYPEGARLVYGIEHLYSYGSNYYSYLWTRVIGQDLFSVFQQKGILDSKTGLKYRKSILEKGSSEEETKIIKDFLGRDFNNESFIKQLDKIR